MLWMVAEHRAQPYRELPAGCERLAEVLVRGAKDFLLDGAESAAALGGAVDDLRELRREGLPFDEQTQIVDEPPRKASSASG